MKKQLTLLAVTLALLSCKKNDKPSEPVVPSVVTGTIYGVPFTAKVALQRYTKFSMQSYKPEDLVAIYLSADQTRSCASTNSDFAIRLTAPRKVGTYSQNDTYILVNDPRDPTGREGYSLPKLPSSPSPPLQPTRSQARST